MITNLSMSLVGMLYNFQLIRLAAENGIAAYGVIMYVNIIFMAFFFGYSIGCTPVIGYHYGAENHSELKSLYRKSNVITIVVSIVMTVLGIALASPLSRLFVGYDQELLELTTNGMRIYALSFLLCGINIFGSAFFTALNNGILSASISIFRTLIIQVAAIIILPIFFGINGVWFAIVVAEAVTIVLTVILFVANGKKYHYMGK